MKIEKPSIISAEQFMEQIEELAHAFRQSLEREAGVNYLAEMAEEWDMEEYFVLLKALEKRGFGKQAIGQIVLFLLEAAVGEKYVKPCLLIVKDVVGNDGEVEDEELEFVPTSEMGSGPKDMPYHYFHENGEANIYVGRYRLPDGWRIDSAAFIPASEDKETA